MPSSRSFGNVVRPSGMCRGRTSATRATAGVGARTIRRTLALSLVAAALSMPAAAAAQERAAVRGIVRDQAGEAVAGATVALQGEAAFPRRTRTDDAGAFAFEALAPGDYTLAVTREGYRDTATSLSLAGGAPRTLELTLERIYILDNLTVTATRTEQALGNVAAAVTQVQKEDIQQAQKAINLEETLKRVPGVRVEDELGTSSRTRIIVRGTGTRANNPAGSGVRGVKVLVDGIPKNNAGGSAQDLINVDLESMGQIEVLRGPSSALYGNQSGGVVAMITEEPPATPLLEYRQLAGAYGLFREHLKIGGRTERFSYLFSAFRTDQEGYREHSDFNSTGFHSKFRFSVDDRTRLTGVVSFDRAFEESPGPLTLEQFEEDPAQASPVFLQNDVHGTLEELRFGMTVDRDRIFGAADQLQVMAFYVPRHLGPFQQIGLRIPQDFHNRGFGARYVNEGALGTVGNRFTAGFDYHNTPITTGVFVTETGAAAAELEENATTFGAYLLEELSVREDVQLSAGVRYDNIHFSSRNLIRPGAPKVGRTFERVTPKVGLTYFPSPAVSVYGTFSQGFETPIIGELRVVPGGEFGFNENLDPQISTNFEVGGRGQPTEWLTFEGALFHQTVDDLISPVGTFPQNSFENVGQVDQLGVELAGSVRSRAGVGLAASYTYADFTIEEFVTPDADFSGNRLPGIPEHTLFGELEYRHPSGFEASLDAQHVSSFFHNNLNDSENDPYTVLNLRARHELDAGSVRLGPYAGIKNLTDEVYSAFALINDTSRRFYNPLPGLHAFGGLTITF